MILNIVTILGDKRIKSGIVKTEPLAINHSTIIPSMHPTIINPEEETAYEIFLLQDDGAISKLIRI